MPGAEGMDAVELAGMVGAMDVADIVAPPDSLAEHGAAVSATRARMVLNPADRALLEVLIEMLAAGQNVTLPGLGTLYVQRHAARPGRNPRTGERLLIPAMTRVHFKMASRLRGRIN